MSSTKPVQKQLFSDDDIAIPPPRVAREWYCTKCGDAGAAPEPGILTVDPRYSIGYCDCTKGRVGSARGYAREKVSLVADFAWDREAWEVRQARAAERKAYDKIVGGAVASPEEHAAAARFKVRAGIRGPKDV